MHELFESFINDINQVTGVNDFLVKYMILNPLKGDLSLSSNVRTKRRLRVFGHKLIFNPLWNKELKIRFELMIIRRLFVSHVKGSEINDPINTLIHLQAEYTRFLMEVLYG